MVACPAGRKMPSDCRCNADVLLAGWCAIGVILWPVRGLEVVRTYGMYGSPWVLWVVANGLVYFKRRLVVPRSSTSIPMAFRSGKAKELTACMTRGRSGSPAESEPACCLLQ